MNLPYDTPCFGKTGGWSKKEALLVLKIARPYFIKVSVLNYMLNEGEQEFVWSYFCLEKNYSVPSFWKCSTVFPSKNEQYIIKIMNFLSQSVNATIVLSVENYLMLIDLLDRLSGSGSLTIDKSSFVRMKETLSVK